MALKADSLRKLDRAFFARDAATVARELVGKIIVQRIEGRERRARIVETEAYLGPVDLASHSSKGRTRRTEVMFGPPGYAYVYFIYGMYEMFNVVTGIQGGAHAVLLRAAEPLDEWDSNLSGPGKLAGGLGIGRSHNGLDLTGNRLFFLDDPTDRPRIKKAKRIGVDYAGRWKDRLLRFLDSGSGAVSGKRRKEKGRKMPPRAVGPRPLASGP